MALVEKKLVRRNPEKKKAKGYPKSVYENKEWEKMGWKNSKKTVAKKPVKKVAAKKKENIPSGGISLGVKSKTTWKQTPTSKAVDDRKHKKEWRAWAKGGHKGSQPIRPAWVGATATTKRRTKYKTDAKGGKTTRSVTDFRGPGGMIPEHLKMARPTPKSKPKKRVIGHEKTSTWSGKASDVRKPTVKRKKIYSN